MRWRPRSPGGRLSRRSERAHDRHPGEGTRLAQDLRGIVACGGFRSGEGNRRTVGGRAKRRASPQKADPLRAEVRRRSSRARREQASRLGVMPKPAARWMEQNLQAHHPGSEHWGATCARTNPSPLRRAASFRLKIEKRGPETFSSPGRKDRSSPIRGGRTARATRNSRDAAAMAGRVQATSGLVAARFVDNHTTYRGTIRSNPNSSPRGAEQRSRS